MKVGQVCTRGVVSISRSAPLVEAAKLMCQRHVGSVIVTHAPAGQRHAPNQNAVAGIITDRDIVQAQLERVADLSRVQVGEVMTEDPLVLSDTESVENALLHMRARRVRRAPVVAANGALVGLVSTDDLLAHVAGELSTISSLVARQPQHEAGTDYCI